MFRFSAERVTSGLARAAFVFVVFVACGNGASGGNGETRTSGSSDGDPQGAGGATGATNTTDAGASGGAAQGGTSATRGASTIGGAGATSGGNAQGGGATGGSNSTGASGGAGGATNTECPEFPEGTVLCHTQEECDTGLVCTFYEPPPCGINDAPLEGRCQTDEDCGDEICEVSGIYNCPPGVLMCQPHCSDAPCQEGYACQDDGRCEPIGCDEEGYDCPEGSVCSPEEVATSTAHGCVYLTCSEGRECDSGWVCDPEGSSIASGCRRLRCDEAGGAECPDNYACDPEASSLSTGCVQRSCSSDAECDCGFCVSERCMPRGRCLPPEPGFCGCG